MVKQTAVLQRVKRAWMKKQEFLKKGVYKVNPVPFHMKTSLEARHITPIDPHNEVTVKEEWKKEEVSKEIPPDFRNTWTPKREKDENRELNYWLTNSTVFSGGIQQACLLTKTQRLGGLPQRILQTIKAVEKHPFYLKEVENTGLYQVGILHSQIWDTTMLKLPKRRDTANLQWKFRREIGIPHGKSATILLNHLLYAAGHMSESHPKLITDRRSIFKPEIELNYDYLGNNIIIRAISECQTYGKNPLPPFLGKDFIKLSKEHEIPPLDPLLPTIDLEETDRIFNGSRGAVPDVSDLGCRHAQTMFRATGNICKVDKIQAYNLMLAFASAVTEARQRYGITEGVLRKPIVIQNVNLTYNKINFVYFQLNTLDTHTKDGIKNFAWFDSQIMFKKVLPKPWKEKNRHYKDTKYVDLRMEPFKHFLAAYLNGMSKI